MLGFLQRYRIFLSKFVMANGKFILWVRFAGGRKTACGVLVFFGFYVYFRREKKIMVMKGYMNRLVWMALVLGIVAELEEDEV